MAVTVDLANLTTVHNADSNTGWSAGSTYSGFQREGSNCLGAQVSQTTAHYYYTLGSSVDLTGKRVYAWVQPRGSVETEANGGLRIVLGDGTNRRAYYVGGSDKYGFQIGAWICLVLDCSNLPSNYEQLAGSAAPSITAITEIGNGTYITSKALGPVDNYFWDIHRYGTGLIVYGGTSTDPGTFAQIAADDALTTSGKAYGVIRELAAGVYGIQGDIIFGDNAGTNSIYFEDQDATVVVEDRVIGTGTPTAINLSLAANTSAATQHVELGIAVGTGDDQEGRNGVTFLNSNPNQTANFDFSDIDFDDVLLYGCSINGFQTSVNFSTDATLGATHRVSGCTFAKCAQVDLGYVPTRNSVFSGYTLDTDGALLWSGNIDIKNCDFIANTDPTNSPHAIEHPASGTFSYDGLNFSGNDFDIHFTAASGDLIINANNSNPSTYEIVGTGSVTINNTVTVEVTVKRLSDGTAISGANVLLEAASGGSLPVAESVSIARTDTTATVTHTGHGLATGMKVVIRGADQQEYNGVHQITVTGTDTYTYTVSGTPASPATGTITSTAVVLEGTTDVNGYLANTGFNYSTDQPIEGDVRKASSSPYFKPAAVSGTITTAGFSTNVLLALDE